MGGAGIVDPALFEFVGYDPERWSGFAFGWGLERIAVLRHGLPDLRELWRNDPRLVASSDEGPALLAARVRRVRGVGARARARLAISAPRSSASRLGVPDANGNLGCFRRRPGARGGQAPERRPAAALPGRRRRARAAPDRLRRMELHRRRDRAVALPGAVLPDGRTLERRTLRGAVSDGMILSEDELELGSDHTGIIVLPDGPEPGRRSRRSSPITDEVLEVELTVNRPDLLSVYGLAREVAALVDGELPPMPGRDPARAGTSRSRSRSTTSRAAHATSAACSAVPRSARRHRGCAARLAAAGLRPISNVVDVTNYVMHASEARCTPSTGCASPRAGSASDAPRRGRRSSLDGDVRPLDPSRSGDHRRRAAGGDRRDHGRPRQRGRRDHDRGAPRGGELRAVGILRTSERLGLRSEASNRWEKGVDPHLAEQAAALATQLIVELAGARLHGSSRRLGAPPERPVTSFVPGERT